MKIKKHFLIIISASVLLSALIMVLVFTSNSNNQSDSVDNDSSNSIAKRVDVTEFSQLIQNQEVQIIDLRTPQELEMGKIEGAKNIDFYEPDFRSNLDALDRSQPYLIYCNSGNRSAQALEMMREMGFEDVKELKGGIQAWMNAGRDICTNC